MAEVTDPGGVLPRDVGSKLLAIHVALDIAGIGHAFGGAIALAYAVGDPRVTNDIDINITVPASEVERVLDALPPQIVAKSDVVERIRSVGQDRLRWGDVPVDLFFPQHEFHAVVAARTRMEPFFGTAIPVISPTDLAVFKTMFDRSKDWPDIEAMLRAGSVDTAEALYWVRQILGADHPNTARLDHLTKSVSSSIPGADDDTDPNVWSPLRDRGR